MLQILSRKQLVQLLTKYYQLNFLMPTLHSVSLTDGFVATVPIYDVKVLLIAFLNDPLRMCQENFASNYDIFTWKAKLPTSTLDEIHTGSLWEQARHKVGWKCRQHVGNMSPRQPNNGTFGRHLPVMATQNQFQHSIFVSGIADIHPFLLRVPEVHTENSSGRSGMHVMAGGAKRYMVSDNAKKISRSHDEK